MMAVLFWPRIDLKYYGREGSVYETGQSGVGCSKLW